MTPETFTLTDAAATLTDTDLDTIAQRLDGYPADAVGIALKNGLCHVLPHNTEAANENGVPGEFYPVALDANVKLLTGAGRAVVLFTETGDGWDGELVTAPAVETEKPTEPIAPTETEDMPTATKTEKKPSKNGTHKAPKGKADKALDAARAAADKTAPDAAAPAPKAKGKKGGSDPEKRAQRTATAFTVPKGVVREAGMEELTFDKRLQSRQTIFDEETVEAYKGKYQDDPKSLPPIRAIDIGEADAEARKVNRLVVWDGFQRGEARRRAGLKSIPVEVAPGTWDQAVRLSIGANSDHGLPRTQADLRKAFQRLLSNEAMLEQVLSEGVGNGGANRALAAAVGISKGYVSKILNALGLTTRGDKIVNLPKKTDEEADPVGPHERDGDPAGGLRVESKEAIRSRATGAILREMQMSLAALQRRTEALLERDDIKAMFRELANKFGIPIKRDENATEAPGEKTTIVVTEYWPAVDTPLAMLDELNDQYAKMNTTATN